MEGEAEGSGPARAESGWPSRGRVGTLREVWVTGGLLAGMGAGSAVTGSGVPCSDVDAEISACTVIEIVPSLSQAILASGQNIPLPLCGPPWESKGEEPSCSAQSFCVRVDQREGVQPRVLV